MYSFQWLRLHLERVRMGVSHARFGSAQVPVKLCHLPGSGVPEFRKWIPSRSVELEDTKLGHPEARFMSHKIGNRVWFFPQLYSDFNSAFWWTHLRCPPIWFSPPQFLQILWWPGLGVLTSVHSVICQTSHQGKFGRGGPLPRAIFNTCSSYILWNDISIHHFCSVLDALTNSKIL